MRVALLTNFVPPYRVPLLEALTKHVDALRILVSTPMEADRAWVPQWNELDVVVQKCLTLRRTWRHPAGFADVNYLHIPYDTVPRLEAFRPDVVLTAELGPRTLQALAWSAVRRRAAVVWATGSERSEAGRGRTRLRRLLLSRAQGVVVNGASGARLLESYGVPRTRITRVPYTIATADFRRGPEPPPPRQRLLYVGALSERKGIMALVGALDRWAQRHSDREFELVVAGEGPLRERLTAGGHPANFRIEVLGTVPFEQLPQLYRGASLLVFPTFADEWGLVVNEALTAGVPVLGSIHSQAAEELIRPGVNGWLFDPTDPAEFDAALDEAMRASPEELAAMGRRFDATPIDHGHGAQLLAAALAAARERMS